jgi:RNA 3'-terminal phosphate cyclase
MASGKDLQDMWDQTERFLVNSVRRKRDMGSIGESNFDRAKDIVRIEAELNGVSGEIAETIGEQAARKLKREGLII